MTSQSSHAVTSSRAHCLCKSPSFAPTCCIMCCIFRFWVFPLRDCLSASVPVTRVRLTPEKQARAHDADGVSVAFLHRHSSSEIIYIFPDRLWKPTPRNKSPDRLNKVIRAKTEPRNMRSRAGWARLSVIPCSHIAPKEGRKDGILRPDSRARFAGKQIPVLHFHLRFRRGHAAAADPLRQELHQEVHFTAPFICSDAVSITVHAL